LRGVGVVVLSLLLLGVVAGQQKERFDGYQLVEVQVESQEQIDQVAALGLDVWTREGNVGLGSNHILVPPQDSQAHAEIYRVLSQLSPQVLIEDIQPLIDDQMKTTAPDDGFFDDFHNFEEIVAETKRLAQEYSTITKFNPSIGKSIQGRDLVSVVIHGGPSPDTAPKVLFTGGQHAREWISPATVMYIMTQLLTRYGTDTQVTNLLNRVAVAIVPVVNPDGYQFSWTNNRMWRKNRRANTGGSFGVDLNRNWDTHWCGTGSSRNPASDTYCGTAPFSEPETKSVSEWAKSLGRVLGYIDWHSYGQLILRPFGWTSTPPPNNNALVTLGARMRSAIQSVHGKLYSNEGSWELYFTTGSSDDWCYEKMNVTLSYTIELRDTGRYGFVLPRAEIIPTGQEAFQAALTFIQSFVQ